MAVSKKAKKIVMKGLMKKIEPVVTEVEIDASIFGVDKLSVKSTLDMGEAFSFVQVVADSCIGTEDMEYNPEYFEFAMMLYTMYYYADVDMTKDIQGAYYAMYHTDIYLKVMAQINIDQYDDLRESAMKRVEHARSVAVESIGSKVNDVMNGLSALVQGSEEMNRVLNDEDFKQAVERIAGTGFGDVVMSSDENASESMRQLRERANALPTMTGEDVKRIRNMVREASTEGNVTYI